MDDRRAHPLVGREAELTRVLAAVRDGPGAVLVGESGVGKTSLAARTAERVAALGDPVVWTVATETGRVVPFGALGPLLPDDSGPPHPTLAPHILAKALRDRGGRRVLLVVDDAQWLDEHSATALLGVVTQRAATVLATRRSGQGAPDAVTALWKDGLLERIDVGALDLDGARALLVDRLGSEVTNLTVATLWERTGGNPLYLTELVRFGQAEGRFRRDGSVCWWQGELGVPPRLVELLERRFHGLSAAARDVVGALALAESLPLDALTAIAPPEAVEEVEERGLVGDDRRHEVLHLRFAHPLLAAVATRALSPVRRRRLAEALDATMGDRVGVVRRAGWQLDAADPPDVDVLLAGAAAVQLTDPELAGRFARRALPHDPGPGAALALADSHAELGRPEEARRAVAVAAGRARTDEERLAVGLSDVSLSAWSLRRPGRALADLRALRERLPAELAADVDSATALVTLFCGRPTEAMGLARRLLAGGPPHRAAVRAAIPLVAGLTLADRSAEALAVAERTLATLDDGPVSPYTAGLVHAMATWARAISWQDTPARRGAGGVAAGRWPVPPADSGEPVAWPLLDGVRRHIEGRLAAAEPPLREALALQRLGEGLFRSEVATGLAVVLAESGRPDEAAALLEAEPPDEVAVIPETATWARAAIEAARGNRSAAAELALAAASGAAAAGAVVTALWYLTDAARYGEPHRARAALDALAGTFGPPRSPLCRARAAGIRARADGTARALLAAAELHAAIDLAGPALELAELAQRATEDAEPAEQARHAGSIRERAAALAAELRAHLHPVPQRPAEPGPRPSAVLTARELEVAGLACRGMTDRDIADALVVSVRTVESHLAAAYRKLGVRSRRQLHDALGVGG